MATVTGGCLCGAVRYTAEGDAGSATVCHCRDCQKFTGSVFAALVIVPKEALTLSGSLKTFAGVGGSGKSILRHFCPECGSSIADSGRTVTGWLCPDCACWVVSSPQPGAAPGEMIRRVRGGTLDDTSWLKPTAHFWTRSKQPWVVIPAGDQVFATQPG